MAFCRYDDTKKGGEKSKPYKKQNKKKQNKKDTLTVSFYQRVIKTFIKDLSQPLLVYLILKPLIIRHGGEPPKCIKATRQPVVSAHGCY